MSEATTTGPAVGCICWNEMGMKDVDAAKTFYTSLFGWTVEEMPTPDGPYTMFKNGDKQVCGMFHMKGEKFKSVPAHFLSYIHVEDLEASEQKAKSLGAKLIVPPTPIPDMGRFCVFADPQGAMFGLYTSAR